MYACVMSIQYICRQRVLKCYRIVSSSLFPPSISHASTPSMGSSGGLAGSFWGISAHNNIDNGSPQSSSMSNSSQNVVNYSRTYANLGSIIPEVIIEEGDDDEFSFYLSKYDSKTTAKIDGRNLRVK